MPYMFKGTEYNVQLNNLIYVLNLFFMKDIISNLNYNLRNILYK